MPHGGDLPGTLAQVFCLDYLGHLHSSTYPHLSILSSTFHPFIQQIPSAVSPGEQQREGQWLTVLWDRRDSPVCPPESRLLHIPAVLPWVARTWAVPGAPGPPGLGMSRALFLYGACYHLPKVGEILGTVSGARVSRREIGQDCQAISQLTRCGVILSPPCSKDTENRHGHTWSQARTDTQTHMLFTQYTQMHKSQTLTLKLT